MSPTSSRTAKAAGTGAESDKDPAAPAGKKPPAGARAGGAAAAGAKAPSGAKGTRVAKASAGAASGPAAKSTSAGTGGRQAPSGGRTGASGAGAVAARAQPAARGSSLNGARGAHEARAGSPAPGAATKAAVTAEPAGVAKPYANDEKFLDEQRELLLAERAVYESQASDLKAEAESLAQEREPGDVQFDEESGEGGTVTVDRERDLALSAQALAAVGEIDAALQRIDNGTYGSCERCHQAIPKPRLKALPFARLCVACKSGGLSRR